MTPSSSEDAESSRDQCVPLPAKSTERLLIEAWPDAVAAADIRSVLCTSLGRAQLAEFIARRHPEATVACSFLDLYLHGLAEAALTAALPNLTLRCEADFPTVEIDAAALPLSSQGDGELAREQLQRAYQALRPEGVLLAATDNPRDSWLGEQLEVLGGKTRRLPAADGMVYVVRRTAPLRRERDFRCEFAFRDGGRLLHVESRPGVFSHRRIDPGARRLLEAMEICRGDRVVDLGCGWGAVGLAAAVRAADVTVEALDSNARAVDCTRRNAELNGVAERLIARLEAAGRVTQPGTFDVALGNPPYYANFRIAELFAAGAHSALRSGGRLWMVTKFAEWYLENLPGRFVGVEACEVKGYVVVSGRKAGRS